ncbi:putative effector protein [Blumeria hordei DH14]|uniref:Putative effector protein n=1 Tax=Blumeria graminis f. sp. hordei (strain DH14) TaxID=546991 RepID=N1JDE4_BLUG1|nr:putative effector protein [Blumeria hordei DH14]
MRLPRFPHSRLTGLSIPVPQACTSDAEKIKAGHHSYVTASLRSPLDVNSASKLKDKLGEPRLLSSASYNTRKSVWMPGQLCSSDGISNIERQRRRKTAMNQTLSWSEREGVTYDPDKSELLLFSGKCRNKDVSPEFHTNRLTI